MRELESKFLLCPGSRPGRTRRRLLRDLVWAGFRIHPKGERLVHDVYFDTADARLERAGWSLRARHLSMALELTCKQLTSSSSGYFERLEIEQRTIHETPSLESLEEGPVLDLLRRYLPGNAELLPTFSQNNRRRRWLITHPDHPRATIELVMDRVTVDGEPPLTYTEFEGELKQGPAAFLSQFADVLQARPALIRSRSSKFHRGRFHVSPTLNICDGKRALMTLDSPAHRLAASYLGEQLKALTAYEPFAYEGLHLEGVHQMRIATRRMRAALRVFAGVLPGTGAPALAREAGWLCDVLGAVRDLDVHLMRIRDYRDVLHSGHHAALASYEARLRDDLRRARRCLASAMDSRRYAHFLSSFRTLQAEMEAYGSPDGPSIRTFAGDWVPDRLARVRRAGRKITPGSPPERYHRLRIRIKKLRYALEILQGPYGRAISGAAGTLKKLQGRLGDHQDASLAQEELAHYRDRYASGVRQQKTFDRLIRLEADRAAALRRRFPQDWRKFDRQAKALAQIMGPGLNG